MVKTTATQTFWMEKNTTYCPNFCQNTAGKKNLDGTGIFFLFFY